MEWIQAAILGILQGLTEFLPISSSAHLRIVPELLGWEDPGTAFSVMTHFGSAIAIVLYFAKDIGRITEAWLRSLPRRDLLRSNEPVPVGAKASAAAEIGGGRHRRQERTWDPADARLGWYVIVATIPIVIAGVLLEDYVDNEFRSLWLIGAMFVVIGIVLWVADRTGRQVLDIRDMTLASAILIGIGQVAAVVPGVSRAGATITVALFLGFMRASAARFALLLAIPTIIAATVSEWRKALDEGAAYGQGPTILAVVVSFVASYAAIAWLLRWLQTRSYTPFVLYRVIGGILILGLLAAGVLTP